MSDVTGPSINLGQPQQVDISALAEQMCRIEHKLDLLLEGMASQIQEFPLRPMVGELNLCPVCRQNPAHYIDIFKGHVIRTCGCSSGIVPNLLTQFQQGTQQGPTNAE